MLKFFNKIVNNASQFFISTLYGKPEDDVNLNASQSFTNILYSNLQDDVNLFDKIAHDGWIKSVLNIEKLITAINDFKKDPLNGKSKLNNFLIFAFKKSIYISDNNKNMKPEKIIEAIIDAGADVNYQDQDGNTALHIINTRYAFKEEEIRRFLIKRGANINIKNNNGEVAQLGYAAEFFENYRMYKQDFSTVILDRSLSYIVNIKKDIDLKTKKNDINAKIFQQKTILHIVCDQLSMIYLLIKDRDLNTAFSTVEWLIKHGADVNIQDIDGSTALHILSRVNIYEKTLLDATQDINLKDRHGKTALYYATLRPNLKGINTELIEALIKRGATIDSTIAKNISSHIHLMNNPIIKEVIESPDYATAAHITLAQSGHGQNSSLPALPAELINKIATMVFDPYDNHLNSDSAIKASRLAKDIAFKKDTSHKVKIK
ncbi:MAG: ankyrin repeat domain-containing protein [Alphaproteobacteria bacterium]